jgi:hypothetical protein
MIDVVDKPRQGSLDPKIESLIAQQKHPKKGYVYCAACSHVVSHVDQRIQVSGSHAHHFTNPYGYQFNVGCYGEALGCAVGGNPTAADTWFPGYRWRHATCEECRTHLGWHFANAGNHSFYGLIIDRIQVD